MFSYIFWYVPAFSMHRNTVFSFSCQISDTQPQVAQAQYVSVIISTHNVQEFNSNQIYGAQLIIRHQLRFNRQYEKYFCRLKLLKIGTTFLHQTHISCPLVVSYDFTALKQLCEKQSLNSKILCTGDWVISLWATHSTL